MEKTSLAELAEKMLEDARAASSGRVSHTLHGGQEHVMRQTLIALRSGQTLQEHPNPGEATLHVLRGRVRLVADSDQEQLGSGDYTVIPPSRHSVETLEDSVILLTTGLHQPIR